MARPRFNKSLQFFFQRAEPFGCVERVVVVAVTDARNHFLTLVAVVQSAAQPDALAGLVIVNGEIILSLARDDKAGLAEIPRNVIAALD